MLCNPTKNRSSFVADWNAIDRNSTMTTPEITKLTWNPRVALVRHNLHTARRTRDFTFFKALQANAFLEGTDYVATLNNLLGDEADTIISTLDNLNAGIAFVHQDAFKTVYDSVKASMFNDGGNPETRRSKLRVDISQQKDMADHAVDKTTSSAIALIESQPAFAQDIIANVWIGGITIISDAVKVCLDEIDALEDCLDDVIRLAYSLSNVQNIVDASITALRGVFKLMGSESGSDTASQRSPSNASSAFGMMRRLSNVLSHAYTTQPYPNHKTSRSVSTASNNSWTAPAGIRASVSSACPTRMPHNSVGSHFSAPPHAQSAPMPFPHSTLSPIPPTPATGQGEMSNPFELYPGSDDESYFQSSKNSMSNSYGGVEGLDPLTPDSSTFVSTGTHNIPNIMSRMNRSAHPLPPAPISVS